MVDHQFADVGLAGLYDVLHPAETRDDFSFYIGLVMAADAVLDVGCGTGALLHRARAAGHSGRLCGLDPAAGMLAQARRRSDIEWLQGDLGSAEWEGAFDLIVMTGHAFQVLLTDDDIRVSLAAVRTALTDGGRFVFETRHPSARAWERWTPEHAIEETDPAGNIVRMAHQLESPVKGDLVSFTTTYSSPGWEGPRESRSTLRFLDPAAVAEHLAAAGLVIEEQFGDWDRQPLTERSPEIITSALRR